MAPSIPGTRPTVFRGRVEEVIGQDAEDGWTYARVSVEETLAGAPGASVVVRQRGYVDATGTTHADPDQPLVRAGGEYVLVTSTEPGAEGLTAVAGPHGAVPVGSDPDALLRTYRAALGDPPSS